MMKLINFMNIMTHTLSMFNSGQITLPKKWRSQFKTKKFIAVERDGALIIRPLEIKEDTPEELLNENVEIFNNGNGIRFKKGVDAGVLLQEWKKHA